MAFGRSADLFAQLALDEHVALPVRRPRPWPLGQLGSPVARKTFDTLLSAGRPAAVRSLGVAGLAQEDLTTAAQRAAEVLVTETAGDDPRR